MKTMRYFASRTPQVSLFCSKGKTVRWPGTTEGMIAVPPGETIVLECLDTSIANETGGEIREVTEAEYVAWEKKTRGQPRFNQPEREHFGSYHAPPTSTVPGTSGVTAQRRSSTPPQEDAAGDEGENPQANPPVAPVRPAPPAADTARVVPLRKAGPQ